MRIATITNWAYGATVLLTVMSGVTMLLASGAEDRERAAVEQRARFDELTSTLRDDSLRMTEQARSYAVGGNPAHLAAWNGEAGRLKNVEERLSHLKDTGALPSELTALRLGLHWSDALLDEQKAAIDAMSAGEAGTARKILFSNEYERELDRIDTQVSRFQFLIDQRTESAVAEATKATRMLRSMSEVMVGITALLFLCVLYFILKQRILRPVVRLSDVVSRLAAEDFEVPLPELGQVDEIGDMAQAIGIFRENGLERQRLERERDTDRSMRDLLSRMTQRLQGCGSTEDLVGVVARFAPEIAPVFAGRLYIFDERRNSMTEACNWLSPHDSREEFPPNACWALRRGQTHRPEGELIDIPCAHLDGPKYHRPICVPLTAQGETMGLLYFELRDGADEDSANPAGKYVEMLAENISLALANLRLRDTLRDMAMADPLTGLGNRRQLDAMLKTQTIEADRNGLPLSCLMIDVDHFKRFNDEHGHDAGDAVLRAVGSVLANATREEGMAFRYGGEEFVLLMPGFDTETARKRAEKIRQKIFELKIDHHQKSLRSVTISIGLASTPDHGRPDALLRTADAALLRAKAEGRDRVLVANIRDTTSAAA
ncbi:diguanylate cyclase [Sphingobium phenoxybenzoativorans]|uniref:diguanylate cyclase n=1 Tax=Sphingobium phenoxybenzoativorans TaxID=1592790 RepID=A0A975KBC5_9SPHN|nr:diguanylate cyclase [Sphingobium phenoxybenzoativorans]QUT08270.1 diguanylate cyclase [Sphingobium phenoxybenzoativorans]